MSTTTIATTPELKRWLPVALIICIVCTCSGLNSPVLSAGTLRLACQELGHPIDCTDKEATNVVADFNSLVALVSGVCMIISMGLWTVLAHRVGRNRTIAISIMGIATLDLVWATIFATPALHAHWKLFALGAVSFNCFTGTLVVMFLGCFGYATDITHQDRSFRSWLFTLLESIVGCTAILSAKSSGYLVKHLPLYVTLYGVCGVLYSLAFVIFWFLPNTIPLSERNAPIIWARAQIFSALTVIFPTSSNIKRLRQRAKKDLKDLNTPIIDIENQQQSEQQSEQQQSHHVTGNVPTNASIAGTANQPLLDGIESDSSDDGFIAAQKQDGVILKRVASNKTTPIEDSAGGEDNKAIHYTPIYLLPILAVGFFCVYFVLYGRKTITFLFFKREYGIDSDDYSNILTLDALGNAAAVFLALPLMKKILRQFPTRQLPIEIGFSLIGMVIQGVCYLSLPLLPAIIDAGHETKHKIWVSYVLLFTCGFLSSIPAGIIRTSITNAAHSSKQSVMLGFLTAAEAISLIFSGFSLNKVFKYFGHKIPYLLMGSSHLCGAIMMIVALIMYATWGDDTHQHVYELSVEEEEEELEKKNVQNQPSSVVDNDANKNTTDDNNNKNGNLFVREEISYLPPTHEDDCYKPPQQNDLYKHSVNNPYSAESK